MFIVLGGLLTQITLHISLKTQVFFWSLDGQRLPLVLELFSLLHWF
jgi:hypothetical protein